MAKVQLGDRHQIKSPAKGRAVNLGLIFAIVVGLVSSARALFVVIASLVGK